MDRQPLDAFEETVDTIDWWWYLIVVSLVFLIILALHAIVKRLNGVRLEKRKRDKKLPVNRSVQFKDQAASVPHETPRALRNSSDNDITLILNTPVKKEKEDILNKKEKNTSFANKKSGSSREENLQISAPVSDKSSPRSTDTIEGAKPALLGVIYKFLSRETKINIIDKPESKDTKKEIETDEEKTGNLDEIKYDDSKESNNAEYKVKIDPEEPTCSYDNKEQIKVEHDKINSIDEASDNPKSNGTSKSKKSFQIAEVKSVSQVEVKNNTSTESIHTDDKVNYAVEQVKINLVEDASDNVKSKNITKSKEEIQIHGVSNVRQVEVKNDKSSESKVEYNKDKIEKEEHTDSSLCGKDESNNTVEHVKANANDKTSNNSESREISKSSKEEINEDKEVEKTSDAKQRK